MRAKNTFLYQSMLLTMVIGGVEVEGCIPSAFAAILSSCSAIERLFSSTSSLGSCWRSEIPLCSYLETLPLAEWSRSTLVLPTRIPDQCSGTTHEGNRPTVEEGPGAEQLRNHQQVPHVEARCRWVKAGIQSVGQLR